ncbi:imidazolonepropionase [Salibacter halophilus]|uniref:Imidazolonepropionase n=1 Tax=Salibacter halophilus TaxID=1803916 RepID=A0A6N6MB28_9FLAO|nr:imidazolonepropionase [Salibacter halophilus]KAB1066056.1 imidazolonepropionase [Salibacter halophilus]
MKKTLIKHIKTLYQVESEPREKVAGKDMATLPLIEDAYLAIEGDTIVDFGPMTDLHGVTNWNDLDVIDADGKMVLPAWCDSHTHIVFAKTREGEFVDRIKGLSYQEIAAKGGGILNSAKRLRETSEEDLFQSAMQRIKEMVRTGTGAIEVKSGYGLTVESELKMLRVAKRLKEEAPVAIKSTFLGAHAIPAEYKDNRKGYIDLIVNEMIPAVADEGLAEYIDIFCEQGYFTNEETDRVLEAGAKYGMIPKIHVNQFSNTGGVQTGIKHNARTVDHLEEMGKEEIEALLKSNTMPVSLPSCSFFLSIPYTPAREIIDAGLPLAIATDYNPGSTPSGNIPFLLSLACIKQKLTPEEAINAVTLNGAYAMGLEKTHGSIAVGKKANLIITKEMDDIALIPYAFGSEHIDQTILNGQIQ